MFALSCPSCGRRSLVSFSQLTGIDNDPHDGIRLQLRCDCGAASVLRTGRRSAGRPGTARPGAEGAGAAAA